MVSGRALILTLVSTFYLGSGLCQASAILKTSEGGFRLADATHTLVKFAKPRLNSRLPSEVAISDATGGWRRVSFQWELSEEVQQDELSVAFEFPFDPDFHWAPHLAPFEGWVIGQHVFRSPALVLGKGEEYVALVPDLDLVGDNPETPWFLDLDAPAQKASIGLVKTEIPVHVGFKKIPGMTIAPGKVEIAFFLKTYRSATNPWGEVGEFLWERWGRPRHEEGKPGTVPLDTYAAHTYEWAFDTWRDHVWQEFELDGVRVGAPQFIVNFSQSPNYEGPWFQREFLSIWNQAWFSSLRSASGLARWAKRTGNADLAEKARLTKQLALAAPQDEGLFPTVIRTENEDVEVDGNTVRRPRPWSEATWTNSNRCPRNYGVTPEWYHVLDMSWTALLMLRWHEDIEPDAALLAYAARYADALLALQFEDGFFPGWLHPETREPASVMNKTPETAMSVTFLLQLARLTDNPRYRESALRALDALLVEVVPEGQWEDYETYWSCSGYGQDDQVGKKYERNDMYKQNTLSMFWTAEALLAGYRTTQDSRYLDWGRRTLDELSMAQQVWRPPFIHVPALGGFGVMNFDGEWNDSRQSLFAELFLDYYKETGLRSHFERGIAALKSSFIMMYCPENPQQKEQWEKAYPFFGPEDYGFTMENYGHGGETSPEGLGMGTFTIYDWGNGAACEARNRIHDHYGDVYIDRVRGQGFGIDSIRTVANEEGWVFTDLAEAPREVKVVYEDGSFEEVFLEGTAVVPPSSPALLPKRGEGG